MKAYDADKRFIINNVNANIIEAAMTFFLYGPERERDLPHCRLHLFLEVLRNKRSGCLKVLAALLTSIYIPVGVVRISRKL